MQTQSVASTVESSNPWWMAPDRVDWVKVKRFVDVCDMARSFDSFKAALTWGLPVSGEAMGAGSAILIFGWVMVKTQARLTGLELPLWTLPALILGVAALLLTVMSLASAALNFAARGAKAEVLGAVREWAMKIGGLEDSTPREAFEQATRNIEAVKSHVFGQALAVSRYEDVAVDGDGFEFMARKGKIPLMRVRMKLCELIESWSRSTCERLLMEQARSEANIELAGEQWSDWAGVWLPRACAKREGQEIGTECEMAGSMGAKARRL